MKDLFDKTRPLTDRVTERPLVTEADTKSIREQLTAEIEAAGGEIPRDPEFEGAIGTTTFDLPGSEDNTVTVVLPQHGAQRAYSQSLVRIKSRKNGDGRSYLGMVTAGPFAEPDSLRGDSPMLVTVATHGGLYHPPYHGRIQVSILGEELPNGSLSPPRLRPLPNSPVFALSAEDSARALKSDGDIRLGMVVGFENVVVGVPSDKKSVLPRHTAVLGTTGGGKSTTIARFIQQAQKAGMAVILLDVEGEYTHLHEPTTNSDMLAALKERGLDPTGIPRERMTIYHLVGRQSANPDHPNRKPFSLQFAHISPYAASEILGLTEPQEQRFLKAYEIAKELMRDLGVFPAKGNEKHERIAMEIDEFERGYPWLTLHFMMDVVAACLKVADTPKKEERGVRDGEGVVEFAPLTPKLASEDGKKALRKRIYQGIRPDFANSWGGVLGRLGRLNRLKVFDCSPDPDLPEAYKQLLIPERGRTKGTKPEESVRPLNYRAMLQPGAVSLIDLSDSGMTELTNIVISDLLRGVQEAQDAAYQEFESAKRANPKAAAPTRAVIIIEEAHEFLSAERIEKTKILLEQVARIAKRGRKRWLGLVFVTQLPQHLPRQVFGLVNSYVLHKITDSQVVSTLRKTVSGIDDSLWDRLPGLAPGQAIVSFPHMARPLLVSIDASPAELRMVD